MLRCSDATTLPWTKTFVDVCELFGKVFMNGLKMLVVPLIASSLICGMAGFGSRAECRRLGLKTFLFYFLSCASAVLIGLGMVNTVKPGRVDAALAGKILGQANVLPEHFIGINAENTAKLSDFFLRYEYDRRRDEFDDFLWLGLENYLYEKELPDRPPGFTHLS